MGVTLSYLERYIEALHCFERQIQIHPFDAKAWNNKGETLIQLKRIAEAREAMDQAATYRVANLRRRDG